MEKSEQAVDYFNGGMNCAQSILSAFGPECGLDGETCVSIASPFGGGIGHLQEACGAVTGAVMAIGLRYGRGAAGRDARERINDMTRDFVEKFRAVNGSILCRDLLSFDISTREGLEEARMKNGFAPCVDYVRIAAQLLEEIM